MGSHQNPLDTIVPWSFIRLRVTCTSTCNCFFVNTINRAYHIEYDIFPYIPQYLWGTCEDDIVWSHIGSHTGWVLIKPDNYWYEFIWYMHNKTIYSHIYSSNYDVRAHMLLPEKLLMHTWDDNNEPIWLPHVSNIYATYVIKGVTNISGYNHTPYMI